MTAAVQVIFQFAVQIGMIALTGTASAEHMAEDQRVYDVELSPDDLRMLEDLVA